MKNKTIHLRSDIEETLKNSIPNDNVCSTLAYFYSIFSDSTRLKIIISLLISEMCVNDLATTLNINQTTISHQLKILKTSGAVECTRKNKYIFYHVTNKFIHNIMISGVDYYLTRKVG